MAEGDVIAGADAEVAMFVVNRALEGGEPLLQILLAERIIFRVLQRRRKNELSVVRRILRDQAVSVFGAHCARPCVNHRADSGFFICFCVCSDHFLLLSPHIGALSAPIFECASLVRRTREPSRDVFFEFLWAPELFFHTEGRILMSRLLFVEGLSLIIYDTFFKRSS